MSIKVTCSSCDAGLRVPETAMGKKIKCPKCGTVNKVEIEEEVEEAVEVSIPKRQKQKSTAARSKRSSNSNSGLWIGLGVGGAVVIIAAVVVTVVMSSSGPNDKVANQTAPKSTTDQQNPAPVTNRTPDQKPPDDPPIPPPQKTGGRPPSALERTTVITNLRSLGQAFMNYESAHRHLPPPTAVNGKLSWRVEILPFIEQRGLQEMFHLDEPWDSPHNLKILNTTAMPPIFAPGRPDEGEERKTFLQMFTGPGTCFTKPDSKTRIQSITDGVSNTWIIAEGSKAIEWTRPDELEVKDGKIPALGGVYGSGYFVLCADGGAHYVNQNQFSPPDILSLLSPNDGKHVNGWPPD